MWTEERKQSYIKHVTREYKIHRDMDHPRVVQFYDVFEIDDNSFATVLEYCRGTDLDEKLKREKYMPEKEARFVLLQMISGLRYLNNPNTTNYNMMASTTSTANNNNTSTGANGITSPTGKENINGMTNEGDSNNDNDNQRYLITGNGMMNKRRTIIHFDLKPGM